MPRPITVRLEEVDLYADGASYGYAHMVDAEIEFDRDGWDITQLDLLSDDNHPGMYTWARRLTAAAAGVANSEFEDIVAGILKTRHHCSTIDEAVEDWYASGPANAADRRNSFGESNA